MSGNVGFLHDKVDELVTKNSNTQKQLNNIRKRLHGMETTSENFDNAVIGILRRYFPDCAFDEGIEETAPQDCKCGANTCPEHKDLPDLPLNDKVANILGWDMFTLTLDNAMGALEEYCEKNDNTAEIRYRWGGKTCENKWFVHFFKGIGSGAGDHLPTAICEAIVKHAEGSK